MKFKISSRTNERKRAGKILKNEIKNLKDDYG